MSALLLSESEIRDYVSKYAFLLDMQVNAVFIVNAAAVIEYANPAFNQLTGFDNKSIPGFLPSEILSRFKRVQGLIKQSLAENKQIIYKDTLRLDSNSQILPLIFTINPLVGLKSNQVQGALVTIKEDAQQLIQYFDDETEVLSQRIRILSDELRSKLKLINALFDNSPVGMMILDDNCTIMHINNVGKNIFKTSSSLVGISCNSFYNVDMSRFDHVANGMLAPERITAMTATGENISLLRCSVKSKDDEGLIYESFMDITEIENARIASKTAKDATEDLNKSKIDFVANIVHELQAPLNIIMGYSQLGMEANPDKNDQEIQNYYKKILNSGNELKSYISNLLDISKVEAGKFTFNKTVELLNPVISYVVDEYQTLCQKNNIQIELDLSNDVGELEIDSIRIKQVIRNLLTNAIRFSPANSTIIVSTHKSGAYVDIRVSDNGPGIAEDELEVIFSKYEQSSLNNRYSGGTGLGLAICREIISAHNGRIYAENGLEKGSVFVIKLPAL